MSSPIVHAAVGYAVYRVFQGALPSEQKILGMPPRVAWPMAAVFLSLLPDLDAVIGIPLRDLEHYHNNLTHSLLAVILGSLGAALILRRMASMRTKTALLFAFSCVLGHMLIDLLTDSRGTMLFWPFSPKRFISPVTLFPGVPWSHPLTDPLYREMLISDSCFAAAILGLIVLAGRIRTRHRSASDGEPSLRG